MFFSCDDGDVIFRYFFMLFFFFFVCLVFVFVLDLDFKASDLVKLENQKIRKILERKPAVGLEQIPPRSRDNFQFKEDCAVHSREGLKCPSYPLSKLCIFMLSSIAG